MVAMVTGYEVYVGDHQTVSSRSTRRHHWTRSVCSAVVSPLVCYHCPIVTVYGRVDHCPIVTVYGRVDLWFPRLWCGLEHSKGGGWECGGSVGVWGCGAGCDHGL